MAPLLIPGVPRYFNLCRLYFQLFGPYRDCCYSSRIEYWLAPFFTASATAQTSETRFCMRTDAHLGTRTVQNPVGENVPRLRRAQICDLALSHSDE
jgi:hypothetical protein